VSRQLALDTIALRPTERLAHTAYSMGYHKDYIRKVTGLPADHPEAGRRFHDAWGFDFLWTTNDGLHGDWFKRGRATNMGHAEYAEGGTDRVEAQPCPFAAVEDVWAFDAVREYGLPDFDAQVAAYEDAYRRGSAANPGQLVTGGYYKSIVSGAIQAFGWDMLLLAASDPDRMEQVLDGFFRFTLHHMRAWAKTSAPVIIQHDDFVWTGGPFMHPDFYRRAIIPRYAELWKPLREAGKKVLFCSDGTFLDLAEDVVAAGADGLIFEPSNDFGAMAERFGGGTCLVGSAVDCRDMTFGTWDTVRAQMDRTFQMARSCRGVIFAVGNHIPPNVSDEMCDRYIGHLRANGGR
jgi:hypothetical protein